MMNNNVNLNAITRPWPCGSVKSSVASFKVTTVLVIGSALSILTGTLNEIRQARSIALEMVAIWEILDQNPCFVIS